MLPTIDVRASGPRRSSFGHGSGRMAGSIRHLPVLLCALLLGVPACMAADDDWTVLTMARDGSWGVACRSSQSQAMAEAIRFCVAMAGGASNGCGAQSAATRGGWAIGNQCGDHSIMATGSTLMEAEREALNREISLQLSYVPDLPPCRRVVTVDTSRTIITSSLGYSSTR
jgi:hypothetical protein